MSCCSFAVNLFSAVWSQPGRPASSGDRQDIQDRPGEIQRTGSRVDAEVCYVMIRPIYSTPTFILVIKICFKTFKTIKPKFLFYCSDCRGWMEGVIVLPQGDIPSLPFLHSSPVLRRIGLKFSVLLWCFLFQRRHWSKIYMNRNPFPIVKVSSKGEQIE